MTKKDYRHDHDAMATPFIDGPFSKNTLNHLRYTFEETLVADYEHTGYCIIDLNLSDEYIDSLNAKILELSQKEGVKTQEGYHYNDSPRVFEAWRTIPEVLELARHPKILDILQYFYKRKPIPFQTINFIKGSNQPFHQDSIHFYTEPERWMVGAWIALEDMNEKNGPLSVVEGSHKWPMFDFQDLNLDVPEYGKQFEHYAEYERFIRHLVIENRFTNPVKTLSHMKKGQVVLWAANLLHGGAPIIDESLTRHSMAVHYYFEGCEHYYSPMFSNRKKGIYADKDLSNKDILNHVIPKDI